MKIAGERDVTRVMQLVDNADYRIRIASSARLTDDVQTALVTARAYLTEAKAVLRRMDARTGTQDPSVKKAKKGKRKNVSRR